jgi:hypothetical protein
LTKFGLTDSFCAIIKGCTTCHHGKTLRNKEIKAVSVTDLDQVVLEAQTFDILFEDNIHGRDAQKL